MEASDEIGNHAASDASQAIRSAKWSLTREAFDKLLAQLDPDRECAAEKYVEVRQNLIRFFEWRGCPFPEDHADETLNRVARRTAEGETLRNAVGYILGTARMLVLEIHKEKARERRAMSELSSVPATSSEGDALEPLANCLESCLSGLSADNREMILQYYQGEKAAKIANRKKLTDRLRVSIRTLRMRALRVREDLQACVKDCLEV